jgi:hypothetical protein
MRMKIVHDSYTHDELVKSFRPVIWKLLLQNSRSIVMAIRGRNIGPIRSNEDEVSCLFYIFYFLL